MARLVVSVAADPVVDWVSIGRSAATIDLNVGVPAEPLGAARNVFAVWLAKLLGKTDKAPPSVKLPVLVTVPVNVRPETVPVPLTEVTPPPPPPGGAAQTPSALRKLEVPPPEAGARPASETVKRGKVVPVPVELLSVRVEAVYVRFVADPPPPPPDMVVQDTSKSAGLFLVRT